MAPKERPAWKACAHEEWGGCSSMSFKVLLGGPSDFHVELSRDETNRMGAHPGGSSSTSTSWGLILQLNFVILLVAPPPSSPPPPPHPSPPPSLLFLLLLILLLILLLLSDLSKSAARLRLGNSAGAVREPR
eukprot:6843426-Pyramimonas_sp.AAC.2